MDLKYAAALRIRPDQPCPCRERFKPRTAKLFRFLRKQATEANFLPKFDEITPKHKCSAYALSFFASLEQAQVRYTSLADANDDDGATARKRYGDHIGQLDLLPTDGLMDEPHRKTGHVGLHPAVDALFANRVTVYTGCEYFENDDAS
jgi:hypothetical protein